MKFEIEIPKEFEDDGMTNFQDFFQRVLADIDLSHYSGLCGNYEKETAEMLKKAFKDAKRFQ